MAIRLVFRQISSGEGSGFRCIAQSIPRVSLKPVICVRTSNSAVYTGISPHFCRISPVSSSAVMRRFSTRRETRVRNRHRAPSEQPWASAMKSPFSGSCRFTAVLPRVPHTRQVLADSDLKSQLYLPLKSPTILPGVWYLFSSASTMQQLSALPLPQDRWQDTDMDLPFSTGKDTFLQKPEHKQD